MEEQSRTEQEYQEGDLKSHTQVKNKSQKPSIYLEVYQSLIFTAVSFCGLYLLFMLFIVLVARIDSQLIRNQNSMEQVK